ncbi:MAG: hypothetical protein ACI8R9_002144 [Paraglaciecola sp.]|jgi:hypothetical protein
MIITYPLMKQKTEHKRLYTSMVLLDHYTWTKTSCDDLTMTFSLII